jgi:hypothetical protein
MAKGCGGAKDCRCAPTILRRVRRIVVLLLLAALGLGGCGGGEDKESVQDILDRAFRQQIRSADLRIEAEIDLEGGESAGRPVRIEAAGPFRTNRGKLPSADIDLRIGAEGAGQTIQTGFLSTGDRAYVKFQDAFYEQPAAEVRRANRALSKHRRRSGSLRALGIDPRAWLGRAREEGEEEIDGVQTRHVSGTLDVEAVMRNLNRFVRRSGSAIGGAIGQSVPEPVSAEDIRRVAEVVRDPSFNIYVGKADDIVRRVSGRLEFEVPDKTGEDDHGVQSGSLTFSIEMTDVNGDQEIEAPAKARPLSALTNSLGAGALDGLGGGTGDDQATPIVPAEPNPPNAGAGGDGSDPGAPDSSSGSSPEADAFKDYADCLDRARPGDTEALQECADLVQP